MIFVLFHSNILHCKRGLLLGLYLPMQAVPIMTNVVSWNPAQTRFTQYNMSIVFEGWGYGI